jgi:UDP-N-acetylmuramate dehydrogenase
MEAQQHIARVEGYNLSTGQRQTFSNEECEFAYRSSIFKTKLRNQFLITQVVRKLEPFNEAYQFTTQYPDIQEVLKADKTPLSLVRISDIISTIRAKKLPDRHLIGTAGSFFANPYISIQHFETLKKRYPFLPSYPFTQQVVKIPAARLIEQAGLKGYSNGKAGTSPQHALIIINERGSPKDILEVVKHIQHTVKAKFGITLQPEVVYV